MKNLLSKCQRILLSASLGCALSAMTASAADGRVTLHGHVPAAVANLRPFGRMPATNVMKLAIGLPLHNQAALQALLEQIYDPTSTNYHKYLTPEQFTEQFGPTTNDYQAVVDFANRNGLKITRTHGNRMIVDVEGQASDVENSFHVKIQTYHHPKESRDFFAPDSEPSVDSGVPVLHVSGLDNYVLPKSMISRKNTGTTTRGNGSGPVGNYMGKDFRNAYVPGTTLNGSGQVVGLLQFDGYFASDISTYVGIAGLTNVPLQNVLLDGFNGAPGAGNDEVCLDIEMTMSMAPALSKIVVFEAGPFGFPDDILNSMAASNSIRQLSSSWGYTTDPISDQIYQEFAVQGQTYLNCSGDGDAWVGPILYGSVEDPNTTIVGGTTLTMNGAGASYASERAWNWGYSADFNWNPLGYAGTSGGISTDVSIPSWQTGINMVTNHGSTTARNVPDVALTADNIFLVSSGGQETVGNGGTSAATPLWAGFIALANQQAAAYGTPSVGFLAPQLYSLLKTNNALYTNCFHDVTTGDNTWPNSPTNFPAVPGYDLCTGLGTPNGTNMINFLARPINTNFVNFVGNAVTAIAPPPQPYGTTMSTLTGSSPNGTWALFVQDDVQFNSGMISNGWILNLTLGSPLGAEADPGLAMVASTSTVVPGGRALYYLSVTNYGGFSTATNVIVEDTLPSGSTYISNSVTAGTVAVNGQFLEWTLGNLATNGGASMVLAVNAPASVGNYYNYGTISSTTPDPNTDNNTVQLPLTVVAPAPPQVVPKFTSSNGSFSLTVNGASGTTTIQASTDLKTWVTIFTTNSTASFIFTDPNKSSYQYRFYQVISGQ